MTNITLHLDDGTELHGSSFGYESQAQGEVVFNTGMTGYPESLTDPSYAGQILVFTYPLIGNYGVPPLDSRPDGLPQFTEGARIYPRAIVVSDYSRDYSHWNATQSLSDWLKSERVPGITGIDTRFLTKLLRERGVMMGKIIIDGQKDTLAAEHYEDTNFVAQVSCKEIIKYNAGAERKVVLVDCGVKANILRCLIERGIEVTRVPWDYDFNALKPDALFLANGPGDPNTCGKTVDNIRRFLATGSPKPVMGICMGNQLLAKAAGASVYKLKYGHRGQNQPVRRAGTNKCYITSQNHGYAVDSATLPKDWSELFVNMNDGSNEGICHKSNPWLSVQFHPEACSGPTDTQFLFDEFRKMLH